MRSLEWGGLTLVELERLNNNLSDSLRVFLRQLSCLGVLAIC